MHKSESAQENEMNEILWDLQIQMNLPIPIVLINKKTKTCHLIDFVNPADQSKNKRE